MAEETRAQSADATRRGPGPRRRRQVLAVTAGLVAALFGAVAWLRTDLPPSERSAGHLDAAARRLVGAVGTRRFIEGRVSDGFTWGDPSRAVRGEGRTVDPEVRIAALELQEASTRASGASASRRLGLAHLVLGEMDKSVGAFEDAIELEPEDVGAHLDVSAALLQRWRTGGRSLDAVRALQETAFVLDRQPQSAAATFNQALILEYLGPHQRAIAIWRKYLQLDATTGWAAEARAHLDVLQRPAGPDRLPDGAADKDVESAVARDAFALYGFIEGEALPAWADAALEGGDVATLLAERCAEALARAGKDSYPVQLTTAVRESRSWPVRRRLRLAQGIRDVLAWRLLIDDGKYLEAEPLGTRASLALKAARVDPSEADLEAAYSDVVANRTAQALARLVPLEQHARTRGYWRIAAKAARLRALVAMLATRISEAQERYQEALLLAERAGDIELTVLFHTFIGEAYGLQGDKESNWSHLATALQDLSRCRTKRQLFFTLNAAAGAALDAGMHDAALVFADELLSATRSWSNPEGQIGGRLNRARALAELSIGDHGVADLDQAAALLPSMSSRPRAQERLAAEVAAARSYSLAGENDSSALTAANAALRYFGDTVQIRIAELLLQRGRIQLRLGRPEDAERDWLRGTAIVEDQRPSLRDELLRVSRTAALWDLYTELLSLAKSDRNRGLEIAERSHARELLHSLSKNRAPETLALADLQQALSGGLQAVVYAQLPSRLLIWRVTSADIELVEQPVSEQQLRRSVAAFADTLDAGPASPDAMALAHTLLPPGLKYDRARPLIIVPDGVLYRLPFAALPVPGTRQRLAEAAIPVVAPSLTTFALASRRVGSQSGRSVVAIGVGEPVPSEDLRRLVNVESEANAVADMYPSREPLVGHFATKAAVIRAMTSNPVIHFAGHARLDPIVPEKSRLVLADGAALTPPEVAALTLQPGAIAVLGACDTALGRTFNGEGPMSLVRAFLIAGASAVVASLWEVRDDDATRLLRLVHKRLSAGADLASSLAASQRELIAAGYPPSAWAGFTVIGGIDAERMK